MVLAAFSSRSGRRPQVVQTCVLLLLLDALSCRLRPSRAPLRAACDPLVGLLEPLLGLAVVPGIGHRIPVHHAQHPRPPKVSARLCPSLPVSRPVRGSGSTGTSAYEKEMYQPSAAVLIVTVWIVPCRGRLHRTPIRPLLERIRSPFSRRAPLPSSVEVKE